MADKTMIPHHLPLSYLQGLEGKHAADGLRGCWPSGPRHTSTVPPAALFIILRVQLLNQQDCVLGSFSIVSHSEKLETTEIFFANELAT